MVFELTIIYRKSTIVSFRGPFGEEYSISITAIL